MCVGVAYWKSEKLNYLDETVALTYVNRLGCINNIPTMRFWAGILRTIQSRSIFMYPTKSRFQIMHGGTLFVIRINLALHLPGDLVWSVSRSPACVIILADLCLTSTASFSLSSVSDFSIMMLRACRSSILKLSTFWAYESTLVLTDPRTWYSKEKAQVVR